MIARVTIVSLFCAMTLAGQDLSARPSLPDIPPIPQLPEIRDYHGKFQGVVVHRLEVEPKATLIMKSIRGEVILLGTDINRIVIEEKVTVKTRDRDRAKDIIEAVSEGKFHIYPVTTIDQGVEILTGVKAGEKQKDGTYKVNVMAGAKYKDVKYWITLQYLKVLKRF